MQDVYKNIGDYNPSRKCNVLIVVDDMIDDMVSNKKLNPIVTELNISTVFITHFYFQAPKDVILNYTLFFYYENSKKREL